MFARVVERVGAVVSTAEGANVAGPEGVLMRGMVDLFAQYERLVIGTRTRAALAAKKAKGERTGGVPFGFALAPDGTHLVTHADEQAVIEVIRLLRRRGMSIRDIVAECARRGLASRSGKALGKTQVERIVRKGDETNGRAA
jgi:DNA invertase Pin-like site-specific DNA recombinase